MKYLRLFETTAAYDAAKDDLDLPNVSYCEDNEEVHYNSWVVETRVVGTFNVTSTSNPTKILNSAANIDGIEIDGVVQASVNTTYTFSSTGKHIVKYTLIDPTSIDGSTFESCSLTSVIIPDSVTSIGNKVFQGCTSLTSVNILDSVTSIKHYAFNGCSSLTSIVIPNSVTSIGAAAFNDCSSLTSITVEATTPPTLDYSVFDNTNNCPIYVPAESVGAYKGAQYWDNYRNRIQPITE